MAKRRRSKIAEQPGAGAASPKERRIVVLFADIVGCSEISNHMRLEAYNKFLDEFHKTFYQVTGDHKALYGEHELPYFKASCRGDEGCLMIFLPNGDLAPDVDTAVNVALDLKRRWLLGSTNMGRIEQGLLPCDLAIGIHLGKAYINKNGADYRPEGYAINLAKRIEGSSRDGHFTRVYVSEAARNALYSLADERTYTFSEQHTIRPRGISRDVRVFEVKHHFLPTDWRDMPRERTAARSRALLYEPDGKEVGQVRDAYDANPTNLWLAEEFIYLAMRHDGLELDRSKKDPSASYGNALEVSRRLATEDQRDAGILTIEGFILGEREAYDEEQKLYREAIELDENYPEAHWYLAYAMSVQLYEKLEKTGLGNVAFEELEDNDKATVGEIKKHYRRAIQLNPRQAWVHSDLAAELRRWGEGAEAERILDHAASLNDAVLDYIKKDPYLRGIEKRPRIKKLLDGRG